MIKLINVILLITLSISSYAQVNVIEVDSSNRVIIYNNGTLIENNQGTVNVENKNSTESHEIQSTDSNISSYSKTPSIFLIIFVIAICLFLFGIPIFVGETNAEFGTILIVFLLSIIVLVILGMLAALN